LGSFRYRKPANFLGYASQQIGNPQNFIITCESQFRNLLHNTAQLSFKIVLKVLYWTIFFNVLTIALNAIFVRIKVRICRMRKFYVHKSQKRWCPQIANPQRATLTRGPQTLTSYVSPQICGFAISGTILRTGHLWKIETSINVINIFSKWTLQCLLPFRLGDYLKLSPRLVNSEKYFAMTHKEILPSSFLKFSWKPLWDGNAGKE